MSRIQTINDHVKYKEADTIMIYVIARYIDNDTYVEYEIEKEGNHASNVVEGFQVMWFNLLYCVRIVVHLLSTRRDL